MIKEFCKAGLLLAENEIHIERLTGNVVKIEHWKGEVCAYRAVLNMLPSEEDVSGAVARGWCSPENAHKEMDSTLAEAIVKEVTRVLGV